MTLTGPHIIPLVYMKAYDFYQSNFSFHHLNFSSDCFSILIFESPQKARILFSKIKIIKIVLYILIFVLGVEPTQYFGTLFLKCLL